ncbi:LysR family transcriptional regulator [Rhodoplanes sp.]|uniref:LysR family transcriptional regulator n=1 Tax=Rhodoplanes sp. TaxID=1968906 RepID=UPI0025F0D4E2|nr:LysR family transcriptional regulator [Rhodoplanes sp.]
MITLGQMRCFAAVAQELNFRRAARRLNMTQPPLSRQVQALEHEVGAALLDRTGRAVKLTPAGQVFARSALRILHEASEAVREAQRIARGDAGALTIGFTAASSYVFLPRLVALAREKLPGLALTLRELTTPEQLEALESGHIDAGFMRPVTHRAGLRTIRVFREALVLALPAAHRLAAQPQVGLHDIGGETLITYPPVEGPYFHNLVFGLLNVAGVIPGGVQHVTQTHSILALVSGGLGVALVPQSAAHCLPAGVVLRPLSGTEEPRCDLVLGWPATTEQAACEALVSLVSDHAEVLQAPP